MSTPSKQLLGSPRSTNRSMRSSTASRRSTGRCERMWSAVRSFDRWPPPHVFLLAFLTGLTLARRIGKSRSTYVRIRGLLVKWGDGFIVASFYFSTRCTERAPRSQASY